MTRFRLFISSSILLAISTAGLSGCSTIGNAGQSARNMANFGQQSSQSSGGVAINEELIIPPSLRVPGASTAPRPTKKVAGRTIQTNQKHPTARIASGRNYYVVVGTYPDQEQALDTFVRLSSIGLPGATMESRKTKAGQILHMVRLGPYQKQADIDKVKDSLTSDGLSTFKVVEN
ncbi:MAG: SPOR domain-containing protein [Cocleimonas sp.]|nr:SPOR domain-containing protein [Cocleimonas sp.]